MNNNKSATPKQIIAELIFKVLTKQICVREAIKNFPENESSSSVRAAWHALVHYEADEDLRKRDWNYATEQDEYLETIAFILKENKEIPYNITSQYNEYYEMTPLPKKNTFINTLKNLFRIIN